MEKNYLDVDFEVKAIEESGIFEGYGSVFNERDAHNDVVLAGAFQKSLAAGGRNKSGIPLLWQHDHRDPIGRWLDLREDSRGLKVKGQLGLKISSGRDAYERLKIGAVKGLSIGYDVLDKEVDTKTNTRYLKEISLWEISLVTFPSATNAQITVCKAIKDARTESELKDVLLGADFSEDAARYICKTCVPGTAGLSGILATLREVNKDLESYSIGG